MNSIFTIAPYKWNTLWVFDDASVGLRREAFVGGTDDILDTLTARIPDAQRGFVCQFSATQFPGADIVFRHVRSEKMDTGEGSRETGNYYFCEQTQSEGWLCPALFCYFTSAPKTIYARFLPRGRKSNSKTKTTKQNE